MLVIIKDILDETSICFNTNDVLFYEKRSSYSNEATITFKNGVSTWVNLSLGKLLEQIDKQAVI